MTTEQAQAKARQLFGLFGVAWIDGEHDVSRPPLYKIGTADGVNYTIHAWGDSFEEAFRKASNHD